MNNSNDNKILNLEKGKQGLSQMVSGRFGVVLLSFALQVALLIFIFSKLYQYIYVIFGGYLIFELLIVIYMINQQTNPSFQVSWAIMILLVPIVGGLLYLFVHNDTGHHYVRRRLGSVDERTKDLIGQQEAYDRFVEEDADTAQIASYLYQYGHFPTFDHCHVEYFPIGQDVFDDVIKSLEEAREYIYLEFFIIKEGYMLGRILNILKQKVDEGVKVKFMYDGTCSFTKVSMNYDEKVRELGIECKPFAPLRPIVSTHYNNRDHRKIIVIDGKIAYTGGFNLSDEYININSPYGYWKDNGIKIEGKAVQSFELMFLKMWENDNRDLPDIQLPVCQFASFDEPGYIIPYGDQPFDDESIAEMVYFDMINKAKNYIYISSPYLILDNEMVTALKFAAKRGVDVRIVLPGIPDKVYANILAKEMYAPLTKGGVKLYEYTPGFNHAKVFVVDDIKATVGTVNLDYRSLYLHFECGLYMYGVDAIADVKKDIDGMIADSHLITKEDIKKIKLHYRIAGKFLKPFAPLM